jgi:hypothetical protein
MVTLIEQRWLDDCFNQLNLDVGVDGVRAQKALLFLADHVEWFNYVVSKSHWVSPLKGTPATASDYIDCDLVSEIRGNQHLTFTDSRPQAENNQPAMCGVAPARSYFKWDYYNQSRVIL